MTHQAARRALRKGAMKTLGLHCSASREAIRRAYRRLAFACHPDLHGGCPEMARRFQALTDAYRLALEGAPFGRSARPKTAAPAPPPGAFPTSPHPPSQGRNRAVRLMLDFTRAALGGEVSLRYDRLVPCPVCGGDDPRACTSCGGAGLTLETASLSVRIPAGVADGETLRVPGGGDYGARGGPAGDLHIQIALRGHPAFQRIGLDLYSDVRLPAWRLLGGGLIRVNTIHGPKRVPIPPMTEPGSLFRLPGWGVHREQDGCRLAGDHYVRIREMAPEPSYSSGRREAAVR